MASAATAKISSKAEASILTTLAVSLSYAFSDILTFMLEWDDQPELSAEVAINYDFYDDQLSAQELIQYMKAWQSGGISQETYYNLLEKREAYPEGHSREKEFNSIQEQMGVLYSLSDEKYLEVTARLDKLAEYTKQMETGAVASLVASGMTEDLGGLESAEKIKEFEEGAIETETPSTDAENSTDSESDNSTEESSQNN